MTAADERVGVWDAEAADFDEAADHGLRDPAVRARWRELLLRVLPPAPALVADLGCGTATLSVLLAEEGYAVDGVDFSHQMLARAAVKAAAHPDVRLLLGDAYDPPLAGGGHDVVLCRHVLWAMPDPAVALARWVGLLAPGGRLVLVEGHWSDDAGLRSAETLDLVAATGLSAALVPLPEAGYWGREIADERYLVVATGPAPGSEPGSGVGG